MNFSSAMTDSNEGKSQLRLFREAAGLTRAELGNRMGVSERQIYDWENGVKLPRVESGSCFGSRARSFNFVLFS
jgi:DNA-binding XRE family transcriptional regulator